MRRFDSVFSGRNIGNLKGSVLARNSKIRVIKNTNPGEHPGMNVALEFQKLLGLGESEAEFGPVRHLRHVLFFVARVGVRQIMNVMKYRVGVLDLNLLFRLHGKDLRYVLAALLIEERRRSRSPRRFTRNSLQ